MTSSAPTMAPLSQGTLPCLELENVTISYGGSEAVRGVYMQIPRGRGGSACTRHAQLHCRRS